MRTTAPSPVRASPRLPSDPGAGAPPSDLRIAVFTESMLPLVDGVSHTLAHLFATLREQGIDFRCYAPFVPPEGVAWRERVRRVASVACPLHPEYRVSLPGGRSVAADLETFAPTIVHVVSPTPMAVWAQRQALRLGVPVVGSFHTDFVAYFRYWGMRLLEPVGWRLLRAFYGRCRATYAPSPSTIAALRAHGLDNVRLWSRGVDAQRFSPAWRAPALRAALGADERTPLVLVVSRLVKEKNLAQLAAIDALLRARGRRFVLALVGDGPERKRLGRALPHAVFAGHQTGTALSRWYASADVFVLPSATETFANVVQEAMASGVPAVVADQGGPPGVIQPGRSGLVARAGDARDFADRIDLLLRDGELRATMGRAARAHAEGRTWDAVNAVLVREYEALARPADRAAPVARP